MPILENALLVRTDSKNKTLGIYYVIPRSGSKLRTALLTELPMHRLEALALGKATRCVGECILLGMESTRTSLFGSRSGRSAKKGRQSSKRTTRK